jgi:Raf kinase inhibitor-like YbhB/YbcL family protein
MEQHMTLSIRTGLLRLSGCLLLLGFSAAHAASCDDACLSHIMQSYLAHLVTHDPNGLPWSATLIARENAVQTKPGEGIWKNLSRIRSSVLVSDAMTGEVVSVGAVDASTGLAALFVRLKIVSRKIQESEIIFNANNNAFAKPENLLQPDILYETEVPAQRRSSRAQLLTLANLYLEGISSHDGSAVPFSDRCDRYASGAKVTNSPDHPADKEGGTCAGSMLHLTGQVVVNRRFPIIDVPRGLIVVMFLIPHHERATPGSTHVGEVFKVVDGKIRSIEEFSFGGGFPPDSGFEADVETGTVDTPRAMNMHPSPQFLQALLSAPPPVMTIDQLPAGSGSTLTVSSQTLGAEGTFPPANTGWGASVSPQVSWTSGPAGTGSYVLIMEDGTVGMNRKGVLHWLVFNIPASSTGLPEGLKQPPAGLLMGANQAGEAAYTGPHSPAGGPVFHYHIQVFAVDRVLTLPAGSAREAVVAAIRDHVLAKGELVGNFQGPVI